MSYLLVYFASDVNMTSLSLVTLMSCDSICCMRGKCWSTHWLMTQLTNGQHACVLVFLPVVDIFTHTLWLSICFLCTWWTLFHTMLDALGIIMRVHYKSMKCDVSFSQGRISSLFRWGEHVIRVCVTMFFLLTAVQKLYKNSSGDEIAKWTFYDHIVQYFKI